MTVVRYLRVTRGLAVAAVVVGALVLSVGVAGVAAAPAPGGPVTDYANYPPALPDGCPDGPAALIDVQWANSRGAVTDNLASLDVQSGEAITTSWASFAPGCTGLDGTPAIAVSVAAYVAGAFPFDPGLDQKLLDGWQSCGAQAGPCAQENGRYVLRLVLPTTEQACLVQFETVLGFPLAVVGPSGSYYNRVLRGDDRPNMLVGANGYEVSPCLPPSPSTSTAPVTTAAPAVAPVTTVTTTTSPAPAAAAVSPAAAALPAAQQLPFTGRSTVPLVVLGVGMMGFGLMLSLLSRRQLVGLAHQPQGHRFDRPARR